MTDVTGSQTFWTEENFFDEVQQAVLRLPEPFQRQVREHVFFVVADRDPVNQSRLAEFFGFPLPSEPGFAIRPSMVTFFRLDILDACVDDGGVQVKIQDVLQHEVAHLFGISDERLRELLT